MTNLRREFSGINCRVKERLGDSLWTDWGIVSLLRGVRSNLDFGEPLVIRLLYNVAEDYLASLEINVGIHVSVNVRQFETHY